MTNISVKIVLRISFLFFSNAYLEFGVKKVTWRSYITAKTLVIAEKVELINNYEFIKVALDRNFNIFVIYVAILRVLD